MVSKAADCYFNEGTGELYPRRRAGDRRTGPKLLAYMYGHAYVGDPLEIMARCRAGWIAAKRSKDWTASGRKAEYEYFRLVAMRRLSRARLAQAEMLAMGARCVTRVVELRAAA